MRRWLKPSIAAVLIALFFSAHGCGDKDEEKGDLVVDLTDDTVALLRALDEAIGQIDAAVESADQDEAAATPDVSDQEKAAATASEEEPAAEEQDASPGETAGGTEETAKADN